MGYGFTEYHLSIVIDGKYYFRLRELGAVTQALSGSSPARG